MNFINKNQSKYEPPFPIEFDFYNIICRRDPPKDADLRAIHYTITSMQNTLTYKDENNLVIFLKNIVLNTLKRSVFNYINYYGSLNMMN